jgi:hypothetical protein
MEYDSKDFNFVLFIFRHFYLCLLLVSLGLSFFLFFNKFLDL